MSPLNTPSSMRGAYALAVVAVAAASFGLETIAFPTGIWRDEATSYFESSLPHLTDVIARVRISELNPPLFFTILHEWLRIVGRTPEAMKLLSLAFSAGSLVLTYFIARIATDRTGALVAMAFVGSDAIAATYASEIRPYAMAAFLCVAGTYAMVRWYRDGGARPWLACAAVANLAFAYTTYVAAFDLVALTLVIAAAPRSLGERLKAGAWAVAVPVVGAIPVAFLARSQAAIDPYPLVTPLERKPLAFVMRAYEALPLQPAHAPHLVAPALGALVALVLAAIAVAALRACRRSPHDAASFVALTSATTPLVVASAEATLGLDANRYLAPVLPLGAIALAYGVHHALRALGATAYRWTAAGSIALVILAAFHTLAAEALVPKSSMEAVARTFSVREDPHLEIVVAPDEAVQTLVYYEGTTRGLHGFYRYDRPDVYDLRGLGARMRDPSVVDDALRHVAALAASGTRELVLVQINAPTNPYAAGRGVEYPFVEDFVRRSMARYRLRRRADYDASFGEAATAFVFQLDEPSSASSCARTRAISSASMQAKFGHVSLRCPAGHG